MLRSGALSSPTPASVRAAQLLCLQTGLLGKVTFKGVLKPLFYSLASTIPRTFSLMPVSPTVKQYFLLSYLLQTDKKGVEVMANFLGLN